jgi:hypothetical protein
MLKNKLNSSLILIMPFKLQKINKITNLKNLLTFCNKNQIKYLSLHSKDFFSHRLSEKQIKKTNETVLNYLAENIFQIRQD